MSDSSKEPNKTRVEFSLRPSRVRPGDLALALRQESREHNESKEKEGELIHSVGPDGIVSLESKKHTKKKRLAIPIPVDPLNEDDSEESVESAIEETRVHDEALSTGDGQFGLILSKRLSERNKETVVKRKPYITKNKLKKWREIESEPERYKYDLSLRPDSPGEDAYNRVPIDEYGMAMLLGMSWKPEDERVKIVEYAKRQNRLGLGAEPRPFSLVSKKKNGKRSLTTYAEYNAARCRSKSDEKNKIQRGSRVSIISGPHEGLTAIIRFLCSDVKSIVTLESSGADVEVDQNSLMLMKHQTLGGQKNSPSSSREKYPDIHSFGGEPSPSNKPSKATSRADCSIKETNTLWVMPNIRVRICSKRYRNGRFYCQKGTIVDVVSGFRCAVHLDDGTSLDDIDQDDLETVVPPVGKEVIIVKGPNRGALGIILKKDVSLELAYIRTHDELAVQRLSMDDIAQYTA